MRLLTIKQIADENKIPQSTLYDLKNKGMLPRPKVSFNYFDFFTNGQALSILKIWKQRDMKKVGDMKKNITSVKESE